MRLIKNNVLPTCVTCQNVKIVDISRLVSLISECLEYNINPNDDIIIVVLAKADWRVTSVTTEGLTGGFLFCRADTRAPTSNKNHSGTLDYNGFIFMPKWFLQDFSFHFEG